MSQSAIGQINSELAQATGFQHHKAMKSNSQKMLPLLSTKGKSLNLDRESITFLLGETFNLQDALYLEAFKYYCNHPQNRTTYIITHCRSLLEVRNYLAQYPPANGLAWGTINIVVQGKDALTLNTSIYPQGKEATLRNMLAALETRHFPSLSAAQIDQHSKLHLHGIHNGKDQNIVRALSLLLFNQRKSDQQAQVLCSEGILYFDEGERYGKVD